MENFPESRLAGICIPIVCCTEVEPDTTEQKYDISGPLFSYSFQKSFRRTIFSSTDSHMKNFIANSVESTVQNSGDYGIQSKDTSNASEVIVSLVNRSTVLQKAFKYKWNDVTSSEKSVNDYYFNMLRYCKIFAKRSQNGDAFLESDSLSEMKKAYKKLIRKSFTGVCDLSGWRLTCFQVYRVEKANKVCKDLENFEKDHLLKTKLRAK